jgi:hypothetical protein
MSGCKTYQSQRTASVHKVQLSVVEFNTVGPAGRMYPSPPCPSHTSSIRALMRSRRCFSTVLCEICGLPVPPPPPNRASWLPLPKPTAAQQEVAS